MQNIKAELLKLHDSLNEEEFDLFDFLDTILVIDEQFDDSDVFSSFCNIWGTEEAKEHDEFDEDTTNFVNRIQAAPYVDTENLKEMYFEDIKERLEAIIEFL